MLNREIASRRFLPFLSEVLMMGWVRRVWAAASSAYCLPPVLPPRVMSLKFRVFYHSFWKTGNRIWLEFRKESLAKRPSFFCICR
jgi:hypothetical protein